MKLVFTVSILLFMTTLHAQQSVEGIWNTGNDNTKIEIAATNGVYEGTIVSSDNANAKIGKQLIKDVQSVDGEWKGKLYAAKRDKWMNAVLTTKNNQLILTVGEGWQSKTLEWSRD
ncbi:MAG: hypothetical protein AAF587_34550 [Bacteroidota bacterium]